MYYTVCEVAKRLNLSPREADALVGSLLSPLSAQARRCTLLVGSSLGGFYALRAARAYGCPTAVVNPCLMPWDFVPQQVGLQTIFGTNRTIMVKPGFADEFRELAAEMPAAPLDPADALVLLSTADETLDWHIADRALRDSPKVLSTEDDILILDPESEFGYLTEALGGEVIRISATSDTHINALDMDRAYGDERNPIVSKSEFVLSLFEQLIGDGMVTAKEKSILGRCTEQVYLPYIRNGYKGTPPTLQDFYRLLQMQPEPEAQGLALSSELFITGTLNTFARHTNVDTQARIIAYDIRELGEQLMPLGMLVTLDAIYNRVIQNWKKGRRTWIFCDEFYILFRYEYSANFFYKLWKRIRKYNGLVTGLTQNVDELLRSDTARLMLANSEFLVMLNQSATDRAELAKLLNISDNQLGYVTNVPAGCGLIRCAGNIVPFTNSFPKNTKLYKLMSTNPSEKKE